jgi:hypothetical protein
MLGKIVNFLEGRLILENMSHDVTFQAIRIDRISIEMYTPFGCEGRDLDVGWVLSLWMRLKLST